MIGFIIMQIGNPALDKVCKDAIEPALLAVGLPPRRVDKHNEGGLLKSEIIRFIEDAEVIVADLTNERPNVYLEIGYAMGIDKFRNLILTVRRDHFLDQPDRKPGDPKIHFDLAGYDILAWNPNDLDAFRDELEKRIRRRRALIQPPEALVEPIWDRQWMRDQFMEALPGLEQLPHEARGRMIVRSTLHPPKIRKTPQELLGAAKEAQVETFGWPIGVVLPNNEDARPRPRQDGIFASIESRVERRAYDYWALRRNGDFYSIKSIFEDTRRPSELFFNTRIVRVTETILYCLRLYGALGVDRSSTISIGVEHRGFKGRVLGSSSSSRTMSLPRRASDDTSSAEISGTLDEIEANLVKMVKEVTAPMFALFDFFELGDPVYEEIISSFLAGRVT